MTDHDRDAILARRSLFISAALASLACAPQQPSPQPELTRPLESPALESPTQPPVEPILTTHEALPSEGPRPSWSEVLANAPPLDVPEGVSDNERERLTWLARSELGRYERIAEYWDLLPTPDALGCEDWERGRALAEANSSQRKGCADYASGTHTELARREAHSRYVTQIAQHMLPELEAALAATCAEDALRRAAPRACLSCGVSMLEPILAAVSFAADGAELGEGDALDGALESVVIGQQRNREQGARLRVRGHADARERDPEALARARAEAVVARLVARGLARDELELHVFAASLPITRDPQRAELNRRVDFEVVPAEREGG